MRRLLCVILAGGNLTLGAQIHGVPLRFEPAPLAGIQVAAMGGGGDGFKGVGEVRLTTSPLTISAATTPFGGVVGGWTGALTLHAKNDWANPVAIGLELGTGQNRVRPGNGADVDLVDYYAGASIAVKWDPSGVSGRSWLGARIQRRNATRSVDQIEESSTGVGVSGGFDLYLAILSNLGLPGGFGVHVLGEMLSLDPTQGDAGCCAWTFGAGVSYTFR